jgi:DNA-binding beta-propeller fold protein YncE
LLVALSALFILAVVLVLSPIVRGQIRLGSQNFTALNSIGRLIGSFILAAIVYYFVRQVGRSMERGSRGRAWLFAILILLALLTVRFTFMSSFQNADFVTEYLVYAHGAPATKIEVLDQLEQLSMRLSGDKGIKVAFDNDSSWPFTWYLRDYPNRIYFGENPGRNITEAPVVIVGSQNWGKVEPILGDDYEERTYTFLWWPMEEYRKLSWNAILGDPNANPELRRGLGNPEVRQALWDIFFYRDYEKYGSVFGGNYALGEWPLRHDLRMYIRKDTLATLWDHGIDAVAAEPAIDIYAENNLELLPSLIIGSQGSESGQLLQPRNVTVSPQGLIFVADSGNHRVQVFDQDGNFNQGWGAFGSEPGKFNEPWGIAADEDFVYVADTWNHRIQKFSHDGELIDIFGQSGSPTDGQIGEGLFFGPRAVVVRDDGNIVVTDTGNHRLQLFNSDGQFIQALGSQGTLPGQFYEPVGLGVGDDGSIFVADTWNGRIQNFGQDLLPLNEWSVDAWYGESINNKPYMAVGSRGQIYVTDPEGYRVLIFDSDGQYVGRFGQYSNEIDGFALPVGIATDDTGKVYVADAGNSRILIFEPPNTTSLDRIIQE